MRSAYAQFVYLAGGADHDQMERMREYLQALSAGWPVQQVQEIVRETLHDLIEPIVYEEAVALIDEHHDLGRDVVIVSTSGAEAVEPIGEMLHADWVIATQMVVHDGRYTGEMAFYAYGENKAKAIQELAVAKGYDLATCYAYSDSITDLPMLEMVGHPYAINPDRELRKVAMERGWPIQQFRTPVAMRRRLPTLSQSTSRQRVTAAVGAAAAVGVIWYARRRLGSRGRAPEEV
jgi:HAD superfamily hydrolase (TIGR01490 family)